jgi:hypothetical protein
MHSGYLDAEEPMPNKASRTLEMTHQRNQRKKQLDEAGVPQVGIFWILPDRFWHHNI